MAADDQTIRAEPDLKRVHDARKNLRENPHRAIQELSWLASRGSVWSMVCLGEAYAKGRGVAADPVCAATWFTRAADNGSDLARHLLAKLYLRAGAADKAIHALRCGEARNYAPSIYVLGRLYFWGTGLERSPVLGAQYFERAMKLGNLPAKAALAKYLLIGQFSVPAFLRGLWLGISARAQVLFLLVFDRGRSERLRM